MIINLLDYFLLSQLFTFLMLMCRFGACLLALPGFGDNYVPVRVRVMFAVILSIMFTPMMDGSMPAIPGNPIMLFVMIAAEIFVGVFFGLTVRALMSTMHAAGTAIANQSSLALAAIFDQNAGVQSTLVANFFSIAALVMLFVLNLHHLMLAAIIQSYDVFPAGEWPVVEDVSLLYARKMADAFFLGIQFATPHIILSLLVYLLGGIMTRLMPTFQVFFVLMPAQIMLSMMLIVLIISPMLYIYGQHLESELLTFVTSIGRN